LVIGCRETVMIRRAHRLCLFWSALLCAVTAGCSGGDPTVSVRGKVTEAGRPLQVQGRDLGLGAVLVQFYRIGDDGQQSADPEEAEVDAEGNFRVPGRTGRGILPGKYRIAVRQWDPYPRVDRLQGRFDEKISPIIREITGEEEIIIDVSQPDGRPKAGR
jgi:hypothetical protein